MHPIRVLHVINSLHLGGAEVNVVRLVREAARQIESHVAYCQGGPSEAALRPTGARLFRLSERTHHVRSAATFAIIAKLAAYIVQKRIDIVHTHLLSAHVWGALAARLCGAKIVEHVHDPRYCDLPFLFSRGLPRTRQFDRVRHFTRLSHRIVVLTAQNRDFLLGQLGIPPERVSIIPNPLPPCAAENPGRLEMRAQLGIAERAWVMVGVGRLVPQKNFKTLIDAVRILRERGRDAVAVIVGEGPDRDELRDHCEAQGVAAHVVFAGFHANVEPFYGCADFFLQPSLMELQSLAMLEAMRAGLPVLVAERTGCNEEFIVHGENGFLLDPTRADAWARCIESLLPTPEKRRDIGERGAATIKERCDARVISGRFEALYAELAER